VQTIDPYGDTRRDLWVVDLHDVKELGAIVRRLGDSLVDQTNYLVRAADPYTQAVLLEATVFPLGLACLRIQLRRNKALDDRAAQSLLKGSPFII